MQQSGKISSSVSKDIMNIICVDGDPRTPTQIVHDNKWIQISDEDIIEQLVDKVLRENPDLVCICILLYFFT
ncbi:Aspartyl/glutamyl-tRNA(Asn/Gln) amidotransferase subunit B [Portunus trituberculatus]|uniref:Aspartyl/glutamyl-tRNA(Asn/Gln) amidotransferase subunit B n=1 Tax=Portunus trituberculatus TaxID=210409 RepID=A0A5B7H6L3_PORTR|nr:Aspartyl/glutamyl-tRNA(Asn/Gln) amidotransferase subunit B [Portunus trituberculatus]